MGEGFSESRVPITQQPAIAANEVEHEIRSRVDKYSGEELVKELTAYCLQTVVEVVMTKNSQPTRIERLDNEEIALLRELSDSVPE